MKLDIVLAEEIVCHINLTICDLCETDEEELIVIELINDRIYDFNEENNSFQ
jgi:hypothetical protein